MKNNRGLSLITLFTKPISFAFKRITFGLMVCFLIVLTAHAASFDCAKANTKIEKMICGDAGLSKLDRDLVEAYIHVRVRNENPQKVIQNQKRWLKEVRNSCQDVVCLKKVYEARIRALIVNEWSAETDIPETTLPAPACTTKQAPEYCTWAQEKLLVREQRIVDRAIEDIKKIILPNLNGAEWIPYNGFDETNPRMETYCTSKLTALREGRVKLFPQPQAKSSQIGFQMVKKREDAVIKKNRFKQPSERMTFEEKMADANTISLLDPQYFNPYASTSWFYELPSGYVELLLNPSSEKFLLSAVFGRRDIDQNNIGIGLGELISSRTDPTRAGAGFFKEQAIGLIEIEGELFGIEGGVMIMDGDVNRWKNEAYFSIWEKTYDEGKAASHSTWDIRILALYPLNPPWKEYYRQYRLSAGKAALGEGDDWANNKPCTWNIQR